MIVPRATKWRLLWVMVAAIVIVVVIGHLVAMVHDPSMTASGSFAVLMMAFLVWLFIENRSPTAPTGSLMTRATGCGPPEQRGTGPPTSSTGLLC